MGRAFRNSRSAGLIVPTTLLLASLAAAALAAFCVGYLRIKRLASPDISQRPHSRPGYHGTYLAILTALPAILVTLVWAGIEPITLRAITSKHLPQSFQELTVAQQSLIADKSIKSLKRFRVCRWTIAARSKGARLGFNTMDEAQAVLTKSGAVLVPCPSRTSSVRRWTKRSGLVIAVLP